MTLAGVLEGHDGWVTQLATNSQIESLLVSASRDKSLIVWEITREHGQYGYAKKRLHGHSHFVSDVVISSDGAFALSGSWDKTLRLWDLKAGTTRTRFVGHTKDILSVAFSADHRHIVSGSRDKTIKLWNTLGSCKYTMGQDDGADSTEGHTDWVSCVNFNPMSPQIISCGWDKKVKVWDLTNCKLRTNYIGHTGNVNCVTVSPDGSLCASGGKDAQAMLWDLTEDKHSFTFDAGAPINALCFSPSRYWLCAAAGNRVVIWDLGSKQKQCELKSDENDKLCADVISLCWSYNGSVLYAGYTDNKIRVWALN